MRGGGYSFDTVTVIKFRTIKSLHGWLGQAPTSSHYTYGSHVSKT